MLVWFDTVDIDVSATKLLDDPGSVLVETGDCNADADAIMMLVVWNGDKASVVLFIKMLVWLDVNDINVPSTEFIKPDAGDDANASFEAGNTDVVKVTFSLLNNDVDV